MPFSNSESRFFTEISVRLHAPASPGLYGLSNSFEWVYIGDCDNIQERLLEHLLEVNTPLLRRRPTRFVFEICDWMKRPARQDQLILEYEPRCNRHWSRHG